MAVQDQTRNFVQSETDTYKDQFCSPSFPRNYNRKRRHIELTILAQMRAVGSVLTLPWHVNNVLLLTSCRIVRTGLK